MSKYPFVSFLITVYNGEKYLPACLDSILDQSCRDFEAVIVDDGSQDNSFEILSAYQKKDPRVHIFRLGKNSGVSVAANFGAGHCSGVYLAKQDSDDLSRPERLEKQIQYMEKNPDILACGTCIHAIDDMEEKDRTELQKKKLKNMELHFNHPFSYTDYLSKRFERAPFCNGTAILRRDAFTDLGGYNERFRASEDYDFWLRLIEKGKIGRINEQLYDYRVYYSEVTGARSYLMFAERQIAVGAAIKRGLEKSGADWKRIRLALAGYSRETNDIIAGLKRLGFTHIRVFDNRARILGKIKKAVPVFPLSWLGPETADYVFVGEKDRRKRWWSILEQKKFSRGVTYIP